MIISENELETLVLDYRKLPPNRSYVTFPTGIIGNLTRNINEIELWLIDNKINANFVRSMVKCINNKHVDVCIWEFTTEQDRLLFDLRWK